MRPLRVKVFLQRYQEYVLYQDEISLAEHRLVEAFQFGTTGIKKLEYTNMINKKQCKKLEK